MAQRMALVGRRTRPPTRRGAGGGPARCGHGPPLWAALPKRYRRRGWCFTDLFPAYARAWPTGPHRPSSNGEGQTSIGEALHCSLPQRCGVLVRRACSLRKSLPIRKPSLLGPPPKNLEIYWLVFLCCPMFI